MKQYVVGVPAAVLMAAGADRRGTAGQRGTPDGTWQRCATFSGSSPSYRNSVNCQTLGPDQHPWGLPSSTHRRTSTRRTRGCREHHRTARLNPSAEPRVSRRVPSRIPGRPCPACLTPPRTQQLSPSPARRDGGDSSLGTLGALVAVQPDSERWPASGVEQVPQISISVSVYGLSNICFSFSRTRGIDPRYPR